MGKTRKLAVITVALLMLSGCAGEAPAAETSEVASPTEAPPAEAAGLMGLEGFEEVQSVTMPESGRWDVQTSIVDDRDDASGDDAARAIAICEAAVGLGATYVSVYEADGTTFVLYGHPTYGDTCSEV